MLWKLKSGQKFDMGKRRPRLGHRFLDKSSYLLLDAFDPLQSSCKNRSARDPLCETVVGR